MLIPFRCKLHWEKVSFLHPQLYKNMRGLGRQAALKSHSLIKMTVAKLGIRVSLDANEFH
jgi:hypothetical protein